MRHVGLDDRIGSAAHVMAASESEAALHVCRSRHAATPLAPLRRGDDLLDAFWEAVTEHPKIVDGDARRAEQVLAANVGGIDSELRGNFVQLRLESEAHVNGAVATHRTTR